MLNHLYYLVSYLLATLSDVCDVFFIWLLSLLTSESN